MNKQEFLLTLGDRLSALAPDEKEEQLTFYREMIDDRMEDGLSEEEAVSTVGSVDAIAGQIADDIPPAKSAPKRQLRTWETVFLILGSPIWLSLLIAVLAVVFSLYISLWSVIISLWAVFASFVACAFSLLVVGIAFIFGIRKITGIAIIGTSLIFAGLSIFLFWGCKGATNGTVLLTKKSVRSIKGCFVKKEVA